MSLHEIHKYIFLARESKQRQYLLSSMYCCYSCAMQIPYLKCRKQVETCHLPISLIKCFKNILVVCEDLLGRLVTSLKFRLNKNVAII